MTRETKIGLLVGMLFILVIGILLSDHFRGTMEPPSATLDRAGSTVRQTINSPGSGAGLPPVSMAPAAEVNPRLPVVTPGDIDPRPGPVVLARGNTPAPAPAPLTPNNPPAHDALADAAHNGGEEVVSVGPAPVPAERSYAAVAGDSVSRMAAKLLGANTHQNRQAIIAANPSLAANPNKVIVGQSYVIPDAGSASSNSLAAAAIPASSSQWMYTVKPGDTLWAIATGQLGNAGAIEAMKELNRDALHGGSTLRPGMKLRLPSAPILVAN